MPSLSSLALLLVLLGISEAEVGFTFSTLYSIYDFQRESEIPLPRCDQGCLILVSTGGVYQPSDDGLDPFHKNLVVYDPVNDKNHSLTDFATKWQKDSQKVPLEFIENGTYYIMNLNDEMDNGTDITVWVIERAKALEIQYEIYDAVLMNRAPAVPSSVVTIMSAQSFRVTAEPGEDNSYTARLAGFDNAFEDNPDECVDVARTSAGSKFVGFDYQIDGPLISLVFDNKKKVDLSANYNYGWDRSLTNDAFITSSGYIGCSRLGDEFHKGKFAQALSVIYLRGEDRYEVSIDADLNLADGDEIFLIDMSNVYVRPLRGKQSDAHEDFPFTQFLAVQYGRVQGPESFLIRYNSTVVQKAPTESPTTTTVTTPCPVFTYPPSTSTFTPPTTSATESIAGLIAVAAVILRLQ